MSLGWRQRERFCETHKTESDGQAYPTVGYGVVPIIEPTNITAVVEAVKDLFNIPSEEGETKKSKLKHDKS